MSNFRSLPHPEEEEQFSYPVGAPLFVLDQITRLPFPSLDSLVEPKFRIQQRVYGRMTRPTPSTLQETTILYFYGTVIATIPFFHVKTKTVYWRHLVCIERLLNARETEFQGHKYKADPIAILCKENVLTPVSPWGGDER